MNLFNKRARTVLLLVILLIFFILGLTDLGLAGGVYLKVNPALPSAASNDGSGSIAISWEIPYKYAPLYSISIISPAEKVIFSTLNINESGTFEWHVPIGLPDGIYHVALEASNEQGIVIDSYIKDFIIVDTLGTLVISEFEDTNGDGIMNQVEKGIPGWHFIVRSSEEYNDQGDYQEFSNNISIYSVTGENGTVHLSVGAGIYEIKAERRLGYEATTPELKRVFIKNNQTIYIFFGSRILPRSSDLLGTDSLESGSESIQFNNYINILIDILAIISAIGAYIFGRRIWRIR